MFPPMEKLTMGQRAPMLARCYILSEPRLFTVRSEQWSGLQAYGSKQPRSRKEAFAGYEIRFIW